MPSASDLLYAVSTRYETQGKRSPAMRTATTQQTPALSSVTCLQLKHTPADPAARQCQTPHSNPHLHAGRELHAAATGPQPTPSPLRQVASAPDFSVLWALGPHEDIIRWYEHEDTSGFDGWQRADLCHNAGQVYASRGFLDKAIQCYQEARSALKAVPTVGANTTAHVFDNLGRVASAVERRSMAAQACRFSARFLVSATT